VISPVSASADGVTDAGAGADAGFDAAPPGEAVAPELLQAPNAITDAKASAARRFEPEIVTRISPLGRARARG
jgi:hypothetical protein